MRSKLDNKLPGKLYIIAAPSGAGKTSLVHALVQKMSNLKISISYTTRPPRPKEIDGEHYFFVTPEKFAVMEADNQFLEHAAVFGHAYGTSKQWVSDTLASGQDVILEIDWQGAQQVKQSYPDAVGIFILPPSKEALHKRLNKRAQDKPEVIIARMGKAIREMEHCEDFDYIVINDVFDQAVDELGHIVSAQNLRTAYQRINHADLLRNLLSTDDDSE